MRTPAGVLTPVGLESLANSDVSRLLHQSDDLTAKIDHAQEDLALLASLSPDNPTRAGFAQTITEYIGKHLTDAPSHFNKQLNPAFVAANNPIKATSHALATSSRFFDARQSNEVRAVYDYYATYQAELAVLLTNYWNTEPKKYDVEVRKAKIEALEASVIKTQQESLKPTLPTGTFFDTNTPQFMWAAESRRVTGTDVMQEDLQTRNTIHSGLGNFDNYQLPSARDLEILLEGAATDNRHAWLGSQVQVYIPFERIWDSSSIRPRPIDDLQVTIFDLGTGKQEQYLYDNNKWIAPAPQCFHQNLRLCVLDDRRPRGLYNFLRSKSGALLLLRYVAAGESYWW